MPDKKYAAIIDPAVDSTVDSDTYKFLNQFNFEIDGNFITRDDLTLVELILFFQQYKSKLKLRSVRFITYRDEGKL